MRKYGVLCTSVLLGIMLLGGCSDSDSDSNRHIVSCNIANAKSLVVLPGGTMGARAASISPEILYMVDENGDLVPVTGTDDSGKEIEVPAPTEVIDISADWLILVYSYPYVNYLVNKEKGNTYILTEKPFTLDAGRNTNTRQSVFTDADENFYFVASSFNPFYGRCQKLNVSDANKVTISARTPEEYDIGLGDEFCVDSAGNVLFSYRDGNFNSGIKISTPSQRLIDVDIAKKTGRGDITNAFTGYDGALYCDGFRCTVENGELKTEPYGLSEEAFDSLRGYGGSQGLTWFYFDDSIWATGGGTTYTEVYNRNSPPQSVKRIEEVSYSDSVTAVTQNATSIFILTRNGAIYKFDAADGTDGKVSKVFEDKNYDIFTFAVDDDGLIQFSALDLTNSHKIFATVSIDSGKVTILGDELKDNVKILQRIK